MSPRLALSGEQVDRVRSVAAVLVPGDDRASSALDLPDYDLLLQRAAIAMEGEGRTLPDAIEAIPAEPTWDSIATFSADDPDAFEQVALLAVGAYFMSATVLEALGLPSGERRPAAREQAVDELSTGILDPVFERGCPVRTIEDVERAEPVK